MNAYPADRPVAAHERYRTLDAPVPGGDLHVGIWDPAAGDTAGTLLVIPGITGTHLSWQWLTQAMPAWRLIAPDLRGRGLSNRVPGPYGLTRHADDLVAVLEAAGVNEPITVVGHSMGGYVALVLAHREPARVGRLFLIDGGLPVQLPDGVRPEDALIAVLGPTAKRLQTIFASQAEVDAFWQAHPGLQGQWGPELAAYAAYDLIGEPPNLRPSTSYEAMAGDSTDIQLGDDLPRAMTELNHPAVFLRAERDMRNEPGGLFTTEWAAQWAAQLPRLSVQDVPDTNHFSIVMAHDGAAQLARIIG
ncbi:MAG: alpha/beta hydrolase [Propionibacteriaceae bacterium]|nr:alpha/beta hydrolase [Propionibacteriaceae bacterium]